ncbi:co-chaperone GroES [Candidatus Hepatincolaceae symbiont of Richtersius coronifer]
MNFKPLYDKVLVKRVEQEQKTKGGILIPETAQEKPIQGEVISVGDGIKLDNGQTQPLLVKVGDKVLFGKWTGSEIKMPEGDFLIMKESEILGIFK